MGLFDKLEHHVTLVNRMADTVNADLAEATQRGTLSETDLREAVGNCVGCEGGVDCPDWLAANAAGSNQTPDYCRNQSLFARLKT